MLLEGVYVAIVTPFKPDMELDLESFRWLVERLDESGVTGVLVSGTTGEWPLLRVEERLKLFETAVEARKRLKVIAGVSALSTSEAVEIARRVRDIDVDAILATPPLYFKPTSRSLEEHFTSIASAADKPLLVYNIPSHVGYNVPVNIVREIALQHSGVAGIKATVESLQYIHSLVVEVKTVRPDFAVLAGYGEYMLDTLVVGGDGAIDALANLVPGLLVEVYRAWREGRLSDAVKAHRALVRLASIARTSYSMTTLVKTVMGLLGAPVKPYSRLPGSEDPRSVELVYRILCTGYRDYLVESKGCQ